MKRRNGLTEGEKVYRTMTVTGVASLVVGIISIVAGVGVGVMTIINGVSLLRNKKNILL